MNDSIFLFLALSAILWLLFFAGLVANYGGYITQSTKRISVKLICTALLHTYRVWTSLLNLDISQRILAWMWTQKNTPAPAANRNERAE